MTGPAARRTRARSRPTPRDAPNSSSGTAHRRPNSQRASERERERERARIFSDKGSFCAYAEDERLCRRKRASVAWSRPTSSARRRLFLDLENSRESFDTSRLLGTRGWGQENMHLMRHLKCRNCVLKMKELDEFARKPSLLVHSCSNSKRELGSKFRREKNPAPIFKGRNVTEFHFPQVHLRRRG